MRKKLPQGLLQTFFFVRWNMLNTMVIKIAFSVHAAMAAGVAFQTHQVVATFQTRKARNESQNSLPFPPCAMRSSISSRGTNPMKISGAMPHVGHAAVSSPPANNAANIRCPFPFLEGESEKEEECFLAFTITFKNFGQRY